MCCRKHVDHALNDVHFAFMTITCFSSQCMWKYQKKEKARIIFSILLLLKEAYLSFLLLWQMHIYELIHSKRCSMKGLSYGWGTLNVKAVTSSCIFLRFSDWASTMTLFYNCKLLVFVNLFSVLISLLQESLCRRRIHNVFACQTGVFKSFKRRRRQV